MIKKLIFQTIIILLCVGCSRPKEMPISEIIEDGKQSGKPTLLFLSDPSSKLYSHFKEKPLLGHGIHAFKAYYMDYQAAYFQEHPTSQYAMLADNVNHPFNEFMGVWIQFGIIGLIGLAVILFLLWKCYRRSQWDRRMEVVRQANSYIRQFIV